MNEKAKLYMIFDILGDMPRSGPVIWQVDRKRTEDIKDHVFDLIVMCKILKSDFPEYIDTDKIINYALVHDLEEAITGDITAFEGVSHEEKDRVNKIAMDYLIDTFGDILDFKRYMNGFEERVDIEAHITYMLDKVQSSIPFLKYDSEKNIEIDNPNIIPELRYSSAVNHIREVNMGVGDGFYNYHLKSVSITDEQCKKYNISRDDADKIVNAIKSFMKEIFVEAKNVPSIKNNFPDSAQIYKRDE